MSSSTSTKGLLGDLRTAEFSFNSILKGHWGVPTYTGFFGDLGNNYGAYNGLYGSYGGLWSGDYLYNRSSLYSSLYNPYSYGLSRFANSYYPSYNYRLGNFSRILQVSS